MFDIQAVFSIYPHLHTFYVCELNLLIATNKHNTHQHVYLFIDRHLSKFYFTTIILPYIYLMIIMGRYNDGNQKINANALNNKNSN